VNELRSFIRSTLIEGIVDDVKKKYGDGEDTHADRIIDFFVQRDPSKGRNKYLRWQMKQYVDHYGTENELSAHDLEDIVKSFHDHPGSFSSKDINKYSYSELHDEMRRMKPSRTAVKKEAKLGAVKVLDDDPYVMYRIDTRRACIQYGMGTKWCVSAGSTDNWWNDHAISSVLYMLVNTRTHRKLMIDYRWAEGNGSIEDDARAYDETDEKWVFWQIPLFFGPRDTQKGRMSEDQLDKIGRTIRDDAKNSPWVRVSLGKMSLDEFKKFVMVDPQAMIVGTVDSDNNWINTPAAEGYMKFIRTLQHHENENVAKLARTLSSNRDNSE
jgi:hypothetical protein